MKLVPLLLTAFFSLTTSGWATLVISLDPADLMVTSTGMDQVVDVGILIDYVDDGIGTNTLSGYTLDFFEASPDLTVITGAMAGSPSSFNWTLFGPDVSATSITASSFTTNQTIDMTGTQLLGTLHFTLDAGFTNGSIPILLSVNNALRDGMALPDGEVVVSQSEYDLQVAAVPEPTSLAMMGLAACGALGLRRRRRGSQVEQVA